MQNDFKEIYNQHSDLVYNLCLNYLQSVQDAEEVTQDVFLKIHQKMADFKGAANLRTWIYRITINKCLDFIKAKKRKKRFGFKLSIFGDSSNETLPLPDFNHPGVQLEDKEAVEIIFKQIQTLPDKQKTALLLKAIDGLSQKEIAEIMELSIKAVESLLSRAKENLKKKGVMRRIN